MLNQLKQKIMNKPTIDPALLGRHRAILDTWNILGKKLFTVKAEPADKAYNDKIRDNNNVRPVKPIMMYIIESIEITSVNVVVAPDNATMLIQLNNDPSLQFKLTPAKFCDVSMDKIKEAIQFNDKKEVGRSPLFFRDCNKLTEQVIQLNKLEAQKADELAEQMLAQSKMLEELNKMQTDANDRYYEELGKDATV